MEGRPRPDLRADSFGEKDAPVHSEAEPDEHRGGGERETANLYTHVGILPAPVVARLTAPRPAYMLPRRTFMGQTPGTYRKLRLMDAPAVGRVLSRLTQEIVESQGGTEGFVLIGIRTRGVPMAHRLASELEKRERARVPVGVLDITLYRDDLTTIAASPVLKRTEISFPVDRKTVILCDDVLFTGRTVRAAIDAILDFGRPRQILLCVLVDRGRRELPIEAQFVGKRVATSASESVEVAFRETDGEDDVWLLDLEAPRRPANRPRRGERAKGAAKAAAGAKREARRT